MTIGAIQSAYLLSLGALRPRGKADSENRILSGNQTLPFILRTQNPGRSHPFYYAPDLT